MSVPCLPPRVIDVEAVTISPETADRAHAPPEKFSRRVTEETTFAETTEKPQQILHVRDDSPIGAADTRQMADVWRAASQIADRHIFWWKVHRGEARQPHACGFRDPLCDGGRIGLPGERLNHEPQQNETRGAV